MGKDSQLLSKLIKRAKERERDPLRPLLDDYYLNRHRSENRFHGFAIDSMEPRPRPHGRISPSSIGGCQKRGVFKFLGVDGKIRIDPDTEAIFDDGNYRHLKWQSIFLDMEQVLGKDVFEVVSIEEDIRYPRLFVAGSLDIVVKIQGKKWVIDFKGANIYGWTNAFLNGEPDPKHVWQLVLYMKAKRIRRGMLLYENKNDQTIKVFVVEFNEDDWNEVVQWIKPVLKSLERKKLPPKHPDCKPGNAMYNQCPFTKWCWDDIPVNVQERRAYKNFESIEDHWEKGLDIHGRQQDEGSTDGS